MNVWIQNPFDNLPVEGYRKQRFWLMAEAFAAAGHQVTLWTADFSHAAKAKRQLTAPLPTAFTLRFLPTIEYAHNVCLRRIASHRAYAKAWLRIGRQVALSSPPEVIISSIPTIAGAEAALSLSREFGAKMVLDVMDAWPETFERLLPRGFKWVGKVLFAGLRARARHLYAAADLVTGVCRRYAQLTGRDDYYLAYHGIKPILEGEGRQLTGQKPRHLVYAGNLGEGYDLNTVLAALALRPELSLDIAGSGPRENELRSAVERLNLGKRVRFNGYLREESLQKLLFSADIGIIPLPDVSWVGLPYKLCDYLQAGLKVVSSLDGECGELLRQTGFGRTYAWGSPSSLLSAIDDLPAIAVSLPDELRADKIYPAYVNQVVAIV